MLLGTACSARQREDQVLERVQAIETTQAASLGVDAASKPASVPAHQERTKQRTCDRTFGSNGPKVALPGRPTWINLWAAWCKPCVAEIPTLRKWAEEGGFDLMLISLDDDEREWKAGAQKLQLPQQGPLQTKSGARIVSRWLPPGKGRAELLRPMGFLDVPSLPGQALADKLGRLRCFRGGAIEDDEKDAFLATLAEMR